MQTMKKPLEGITIVELAQFIAGPAATRILADWGANVIKLESVKGDHLRVMGYLNNMPMGEEDNPSFDTSNLNKKFVGFNQRGPQSMESLHRMLETANVFMTNYRTPVLKKMGLDYETLHGKYPKLVFAQVTGYGNAGAEKDEPGYDTVSWAARGGVLSTMNQAGTPPINIVPSLGDFLTAMTFAGGIAGAIVGQLLHGTGDKITVSLYGLGLFGNAWPIMGTEYNEKPTYPRSRRHVASPGINIYPCKDGWILLSCPDWKDYYDRVVTLMGREDLIGREDYQNINIMQEKGLVTEFIDMMDAVLSQHEVAYWKPKFAALEVPIEKCCMFEDIIKDQQAWDAGFLYKYQTGSGNEHVMVNSPVQFESIGLVPEHSPSRRVGYHTREVLREYGYSETEIDAMIADGSFKD